MYIVTRNVLHFQKMFVSLLYVLTELAVKARQLDPVAQLVRALHARESQGRRFDSCQRSYTV